MVRLEPIHDPGLVIPAIAGTFGIRETPGSQPVDAMLKEFLRSKQMLLILDNFEHLVEVAPCISELLEACPRLKCLVTSRTPLRLRAEKELPIPPLRVPVQFKPENLLSLSQYAAVELFIQRAQAVNPDFSVDDSNAPALAEICYRLDGLPLAIELAAAKIKMFTPQGLLNRLEHRLDLLNSGTRDLPERQRTLRGAIDWSFNLLTEKEKCLFRRLSVFVGGFTLEAAETICNIEGDMADYLDDCLASLIDNNLLIHLKGEEGEPRFGMLSTIHEYANELLKQNSENEAIHSQHARFFLDFVVAVEPLIRSAERVHWQNTMRQEFENIRSILDWVCKTKNHIEIGQRIVINLGLYWHICGYITEGQQWCTRMLEFCDASTPVEIRAGLLCFQGLLTRAERDQKSTHESISQSLDLCRRGCDKKLLATTLLARGVIASAVRDLETASQVFQEALDLFREVQDQWDEVVVLAWLADVAYYQHQTELAQGLHEESIKLARMQGDPWCLMPALMSTSEIDMVNGEFNSAYMKLIEVADVLQATGDRWSLSWTLIDLGHVVFRQGDMDQARSYILDGISLASTFGNTRALLIALAEAASLIASCASQDSQKLSLAANLCGAIEPYLDTPGIFMWINTKQIYEWAIEHVKATMSPDQWSRAAKEGKAIPMDRAIALAVDALRS
jgi:predicted ATPase